MCLAIYREGERLCMYRLQRHVRQNSRARSSRVSPFTKATRKLGGNVQNHQLHNSYVYFTTNMHRQSLKTFPGGCGSEALCGLGVRNPGVHYLPTRRWKMLPDNKHMLPLQDAKHAALVYSLLFPFQCCALLTFAERLEGAMGLTEEP